MIERRVKTSGIKNAITRVVSSHLVYLSFPFAPDLSSSLFVEEKKKGEVVIRGVYHGDRGLAEGVKVVLVGERERETEGWYRGEKVRAITRLRTSVNGTGTMYVRSD